MPVLPLLLLAFGCLADDFLRRIRTQADGRRNWPPLLGSGLITTWAVIFTSVSLIRLGLGWAPAGYEERARLLVSSLETMRGKVPPSAVVGSPELWPALPLLMPVQAVPSARFQPMEPRGEPMWGSPAQQFELWATAHVDFLVIEDLTVHEEALNALDAACPGSVQLVDSRPGVMLVHLGWDSACQRRVGAVD